MIGKGGFIRDRAGYLLAVLRGFVWLSWRVDLGSRVRLRGRPAVASAGRIVIEDRVQLVSTPARLELGTGPKGVVHIGARSLVNFGCSIVALDRVTIGAGCLIGPHCMVMDTSFHHVDPDRRLDPPDALPIVLGDNVWLGARVIVFPGVTIGDDSVIGIGSVVTRDIPPRSVAVGSPARVIRTI